MIHRTTTIQLSIELDSDPICGSFITGGAEPSRFRGWIELAAVLESARCSQVAPLTPARVRALASEWGLEESQSASATG